MRKAIGGLVLVLMSLPAQAQDTFCERLAAQTGMKRVVQTAVPERWELNLLNFGQRFLVGGTAMLGMGVRPIGDTDGSSRATLSACSMVKKVYSCNVKGPATLILLVKDKHIEQEARADEEATVGMVGTKLRCDGKSAPAQAARS